MGKPRVYVLPGGRLQEQLFPPRVREALAEFAEATYHPAEGRVSSEELATLLPGYAGLITGWGAPKLTAETFLPVRPYSLCHMDELILSVPAGGRLMSGG